MNMAGIGLDLADPVANPPLPERIDPGPTAAPTDFAFQPHASATGDVLTTASRVLRRSQPIFVSLHFLPLLQITLSTTSSAATLTSPRFRSAMIVTSLMPMPDRMLPMQDGKSLLLSFLYFCQ